MVDRIVHGKPGQLQGLFHPESVKLQPCVFPGMVLVRAVGVNLLWVDKEPFPAFDVIGIGHAFGIRGHQGPGP